MLRCSRFALCKASIVAATAALSDAAKNEYPIAVQIKQHCTIALIKYSDVPAEVFLHRGLAYLELSQPYFALADFRCAAERERLDVKYEKMMEAAVKEMADEEVGTFESSDTHLHSVVNPTLGKDVEMQSAGGKGRGVFATKDIPAGAVVLKRAAPWLTYPLREGLCSNCGGAMGKRAFPCKNDSCHEEYCSRECRSSAHATYHKGVCNNQRFQTIELELYAKMQQATETGQLNESRAAAIQLLMLRVLGVSLSHKILPSVLPEIRTLSGKLTFSPGELASTTLDFYRRLVVATGTVASISFEEYVCALAKLSNNIFQDENTIYAHIPRAMLNHSCSPSCLDTGGDLVAIRDLAAGEEICTSYYPQLNDLDYTMRKQELERRGLKCACTKCTADAEALARRKGHQQ